MKPCLICDNQTATLSVTTDFCHECASRLLQNKVALVECVLPKQYEQFAGSNTSKPIELSDVVRAGPALWVLRQMCPLFFQGESINQPMGFVEPGFVNRLLEATEGKGYVDMERCDFAPGTTVRTVDTALN